MSAYLPRATHEQNESKRGESELLLTVKRSDGSEDRFELSTFDGHRFVNVRNWKPAYDHSQWLPNSRRGFSISIGDLHQVITALQKAMVQLEAEHAARVGKHYKKDGTR